MIYVRLRGPVAHLAVYVHEPDPACSAKKPVDSGGSIIRPVVHDLKHAIEPGRNDWRLRISRRAAMNDAICIPLASSAVFVCFVPCVR